MSKPKAMTPRAIRRRAEIDQARIDSRCLVCGDETTFRADKQDEWYMIRDALWLKANPNDDGKMCIGCVELKIGRRLRPKDFRPAPVNRVEFKGRVVSKRLVRRLLDVPDEIDVVYKNNIGWCVGGER